MSLPSEKSSLWKILSDLIPEHIRPMVGLAFGIFLFMVLIQAPTIVLSWAHQPKECWDIKQVGDRVIKFNKCTGETRDIPPPKAEGKVS